VDEEQVRSKDWRMPMMNSSKYCKSVRYLNGIWMNSLILKIKIRNVDMSFDKPILLFELKSNHYEN
jgi:hypothetical protein